MFSHDTASLSLFLMSQVNASLATHVEVRLLNLVGQSSSALDVLSPGYFETGLLRQSQADVACTLV